MNTWNKVEAIGILGKDPEVRYTQGGAAVASFSVATEHSYKKGDDWVKIVEWLNLTAFGKLAERIGEYLRKGSGVYIEGRLQTDKWEDREGQTRYTTKVIVNKCDFLTNFGDQSQKSPGSYGGPTNQSSGNSSKPRFQAPPNDPNDDDIPF